MSISWIFFDIGWTLVDETGSHRKRFEAALAACPDSERRTVDELMIVYESAILRFESDPFAVVIAEMGISKDRRAEFPYGKDREFLYSDSQAALGELRQKYRLGALANQSAGLESRIEKFGLRGLFDLVFGSADVGLKKPDPRIFELAAERSGESPGKLLMVGDRLDNDVAPAKAAGWKTARIRRGLHAKQEPRNEGEVPDFEVDDLAGIGPVLLSRTSLNS